MNRRAALTMETIVIMIILVAALVMVLLYFTGSATDLFTKISSVSGKTTEQAGSIGGEYEESLSNDYFRGGGTGIFD